MRVYIRGLFSEDDGKPSFSRVCTFIILVCLLSWDTYMVIIKQTIPDLGGQALFLPILYAVNKASAVATDIAGKK